LIQVEAALNQLSAQHSDLDAWLKQARASSEIGLYYALANSPPASRPTPPVVTAPVKSFAPPPDMPVSPYPGNAAPDFTLGRLNGDPITLSNFRGRPTLVNFWASWCPPCRRELPALQAAYDRYGDKIGFMAVDVKEDQATVESFVKELNLTFPVALDPDGQVSDLSYQVRGIPTTIFVDANGVVAARHVGPLDEATIDNYLAPLLEKAKIEEEGETREANSPLLTPTLTANLAPTFSLSAASGQMVSLQDYRDKNSIVLVFYRGQT
jgi:cytochrome c biogenesis protein CcmG/thiol:disulfide interchange protein DsbE